MFSLDQLTALARSEKLETSSSSSSSQNSSQFCTQAALVVKNVDQLPDQLIRHVVSFLLPNSLDERPRPCRDLIVLSRTSPFFAKRIQPLCRMIKMVNVYTYCPSSEVKSQPEPSFFHKLVSSIKAGITNCIARIRGEIDLAKLEATREGAQFRLAVRHLYFTRPNNPSLTRFGEKLPNVKALTYLSGDRFDEEMSKQLAAQGIERLYFPYTYWGFVPCYRPHSTLPTARLRHIQSLRHISTLPDNSLEANFDTGRDPIIRFDLQHAPRVQESHLKEIAETCAELQGLHVAVTAKVFAESLQHLKALANLEELTLAIRYPEERGDIDESLPSPQQIKELAPLAAKLRKFMLVSHQHLLSAVVACAINQFQKLEQLIVGVTLTDDYLVDLKKLKHLSVISLEIAKSDINKVLSSLTNCPKLEKIRLAFGSNVRELQITQEMCVQVASALPNLTVLMLYGYNKLDLKNFSPLQALRPKLHIKAGSFPKLLNI